MQDNRSIVMLSLVPTLLSLMEVDLLSLIWEFTSQFDAEAAVMVQLYPHGLEHLHVQVLKTDDCSDRQQRKTAVWAVHATETERQHNILRAQMADTDQQEIWAKLVSDEAFLDHIKKNSNNLRCIFGSERAGGALLPVRRSSATYSNTWVSGVPCCACLRGRERSH